MLGAEAFDRAPDLREGGVRGLELGIGLVGGVEAGLEDLGRERAQLRALGDQLLQRRRVQIVILLQHVGIDALGDRAQQRLIVLRQLVPLVEVDHEVDGRAAFPPAGVVVVGRDLHEAELLVVIGADEFGGVDRALFERGIDVAAGDLLRHHAELRHHLTGEAADPHLQPLQIFERVDFLAEPAAHLHAGIAAREADQPLLREELVIELDAAAEVVPGVHAARRQAEGHGRAERPGRILAPVVIAHRMRHLDGARLHGIGRLQTADELARGEGLDLEIAVGRLGDAFAERLGVAIERVERFREGRGHPPGDLRVRLRDRGGGKAGRGAADGAADRGFGQEGTAIHLDPLVQIRCVCAARGPGSPARRREPVRLGRPSPERGIKIFRKTRNKMSKTPLLRARVAASAAAVGQLDAGDLLGDRVDGERVGLAAVVLGRADVLPAAALVDLERAEIRLVAHLARARHPVAEIDIGQAGAARDVDMIEDQEGAEAVLVPVRVVEAVDHAHPVIEHVGQAHRGERAGRAGRGLGLAVFDDARLHRRLLDHRGEFEDVHVGHAAIGVARVEIAAEEGELFLGGPGAGGGALQVCVALQHPALGAAGLEIRHPDTGREAGRAIGAGGAVEHILRAPEALARERVVQLFRPLALQRGEQLALRTPVQIGTGLRRGHVELRCKRKRMAHFDSCDGVEVAGLGVRSLAKCGQASKIDPRRQAFHAIADMRSPAFFKAGRQEGAGCVFRDQLRGASGASVPTGAVSGIAAAARARSSMYWSNSALSRASRRRARKASNASCSRSSRASVSAL
ncbi:hypothetical protein SDC9_34620 [bioreactor metagenome]|uniref:Uncharacterized protein n=1 Tax=bioreactor metagenome TaxID=1076179 RepID=A0A644VB63_9ZZZZ